MNDFVLEELISGYLDGELTAEEQTLVERALEESAKCRQIHDEFIALRGSLQSLPREHLDADFSNRVLERIRRIAVERREAGAGVNDAVSHEPKIVIVSDKAKDSALIRGRTSLRRLAHKPAAWVVAAAAALLVAAMVSPERFGLPSLMDGNKELIVTQEPSGSADGIIPGGNLADPLGASDALAGNSSDLGPNGSARVEPQAPQLGESPSPRNEVAPNNVAQGSTSENPSSLPDRDDRTPQENITPPQIVQDDRGPGDTQPLAAPVDLVMDYGTHDLHVVRLAFAASAVSSGAFDEILEKEGISFRVAGSRANRAEGGGAAPELDLVLVRGVPRQVEGVLEALKKRPADFRPLALYTAPSDRILDMVLAIVENLPKALLEPPAPSNDPALPDLGLGSANGWSGYLELTSDPMQKVFAWRAPPLNRDILDRLFPIPPKAVAADADAPRLGPDEVSPDRTVQVMFILFREQ